jgi:hypothetical protein
MRNRLLRLALAGIGIATLGACASVPERAWSNGRAMSNSRAYRQAMSGDMSLNTQRQLQSAADPRRLNYRERQYVPFTHWW